MTRRLHAVSVAVATVLASTSPASAQQSIRAGPTPMRSGEAGQLAQAQRPAPKPAAPGGAQPTLLGQFGDWGAYTATTGGRKVCFALARPAKATTNPPNRPRDAAYMFISSRPAEKVKDEVSVIVGYGFKPNSEALIEVAGSSYAMYTQNDGAWIKNAAEEARLVEALRKNADAVVKGTSARGATSTDTYSLKGLAQALDRVGQECK